MFLSLSKLGPTLSGDRKAASPQTSASLGAVARFAETEAEPGSPRRGGS